MEEDDGPVISKDPEPTMPAPFWLDLGDVAVVPIVEIPRLPIQPEEFFPQVGTDRSAWCFEEPWFDPGAGTLTYTIQAFLVVTPERALLVDACVGDGKPRARPQFSDQDSGWLRRLRATGLEPSDISDVVLTHLHVDHVGWATQLRNGGWTPVFPHARHRLTEVEYRHWAGPAGVAAMQRTGDYLADSVQPLRDHGLLEFCAPDADIAPHVRLLPAPGHTPGNVCVEVSGSEGRLLVVGDALHHPVQLLHPEWSTRYCVDPQQATQTRGRLLADAAASGTPILPAHFVAPSAGRVLPAGTGYAFAPADDIVRRGQYVRTR
jgi:glyoxylase-like metal-dependent hydrolase (beta-lactamase superfamily II)